MSIPTLPSFGDLSQSGSTNAPSGGATPPSPAPVSPAGGGVAPPAAPPANFPAQQSYLAELEKAGRLQPGTFQNDRELINGLWTAAERLAQQVEDYEKNGAPAPQPSPPVQPTAPASDLNKAATVFQQQGWLKLENGQWQAVNPLAGTVAQQLNQQMAEAQARQAELADPAAFIQKYGSSAFKDHLAPLLQQIEDLKRNQQVIAEQMIRSAPKPHMDWVKQNESQLWTASGGGRVPSKAGQAYHDAWDRWAKAGVQGEADLHELAKSAAVPYMQAQQTQTPAPQQPWIQQAAQAQPNPGFNAPGSTFANAVPPNSIGVPLDNDGFPSFSKMMAAGIGP